MIARRSCQRHPTALRGKDKLMFSLLLLRRAAAYVICPPPRFGISIIWPPALECGELSECGESSWFERLWPISTTGASFGLSGEMPRCGRM
mmetsp:Transcript_16474/g.27411  ORF Transcript_16474/g.27411 Transcript_16474/m.27411 type:complete len:91 (+) Transcript_16474:47-319(+)